MKAKKGDKKEANAKSDFAFASCILYFTGVGGVKFIYGDEKDIA